MRTWPGLAAIGAGLIHLGSAAGTAPAVLIPLALLGALEVLWGVAALARPLLPVPRTAAVGIATALVLTTVAVLLPPSAGRHGAEVDLGVPAAAFAGGGALDLAVGVLLAIRLARPAAGEESRPVRFLLAAAGAAAVVAIVTTQSLAATSVGGPMHMH